MKIVKNPISIACSLMFVILHAAFAFPTSSTNTSSEELSTQEVSTQKTSSSVEQDLARPQGRSIDFEPLVHDDTTDFILPPYYPALSDLENDPGVVYSLEGDMATAESNMVVFRPLFTYRKQVAKRRRVYTQPTTHSSLPRTVQKRRYRAPINYEGYPTYYYKPQYDYVP